MTNTNDAGPGSLRQAILDANALPGLDTIAFNIGGGGVQTIRPSSALPALGDQVIVDGTTQPGYAGQPLIVLNGASAGADGLVFFGANSTLRGLVVNGFGRWGVILAGDGRHVVAGNYIGTDSTGTLAVPNGQDGVQVISSNNRLGGTAPADRNVISGNQGGGISVAGTGNRVEGNHVGVNAAGTAALPNNRGIYVSAANNTIGGIAAGAGNVISGNTRYGIELLGAAATGNKVEGNFIGTDAASQRAVPNEIGLWIGGPNNTVGGTAAGARNLVSGNSRTGIVLDSTNNVVQGNYIGTDVTGMLALGNGYGLAIRGMRHLIGGTTAAARNVISGNRWDGLSGADGRESVVQGNYIGTDITGSRALGNGLHGIGLTSGRNFTIGGTEPGAGNVISGNTRTGLHLGTSGSVVQGNFIGTDASGTRPLGNGWHGIAAGGANNTIGGTTAAARNIISGNQWRGVSSGSYNIVQGNFIGTDVAGRVALPNLGGGVVTGFSDLIGGTAPGAGNLISGNHEAGIILWYNVNRVEGNRIGTDVTGTVALGNSIGILARSDRNVIGGTEAGSGNLISGNRGEGILFNTIWSTRNRVQGNRIGTNAAGTAALPNSHGVVLTVGTDNTIGGTTPAANNLISGNAGSGIVLETGRNVVQGNWIGTDATGAAALGNREHGILVAAGVDNVIGGAAAGAGNVLAGNGTGIVVNVSSTLLQGNFIGTNAAGTAALGNAVGVSLGGSEITVGGTAPGAGNLVSGNSLAGIRITGSATASRIQGNLIGLDITGTAALGNGVGVLLEAGASNTTVGGTVAEAGNFIAGNRGDGVVVRGTGNTLQGNFIGIGAAGLTPLGNGSNGVRIYGSGNTVGGTADGAANLIAFNGEMGVLVDTGTGNALRRNMIFGHALGVGIWLINGGNRERLFPVLISAVSGGGQTTLEGVLLSAPNTSFQLEVFINATCNPFGFGEGEAFLIALTATTGAEGVALFTHTAAIEVEPGLLLTATATDPANNTSPFSPCMEVSGRAQPGSSPSDRWRKATEGIAGSDWVPVVLGLSENDLLKPILCADTKDLDVIGFFQAELVYVPEKHVNRDFAVLKIAARAGEPAFRPLPLSFDRLELGSQIAKVSWQRAGTGT